MNYACAKIEYRQGFTLIEVMAALAIVAFGISAAVAVVNSIGRNTQRLEDRAIAQWIVSNKLVELRLQQYDAASRANVSSSSTLTMGLREWFVFLKNKKESKKLSEVVIQVCVDNSRLDCLLEQNIRVVPFNIPIN